MTAIKAASPMAGLQNQNSELMLRLQQLTRYLSDAQQLQEEANAAVKAQQEAGGVDENNPDVQRAVEYDGQVNRLRSFLIDYQTQLANAQQKLGDKHRQVQTLRTLVEQTERNLKDRIEEVKKTTQQQIGMMREMQLAQANAQVAGLQDRYQEIKAQLRDQEQSLGQLTELEQQRTNILEQMDTIRKRLTDLRMMGMPGAATDTSGPVEITLPATPPTRRSQPQWKLMLPLGGFVGLLLGLGLAFLVELTDTSIKSPSDIARRVDLPLLGMVPHSDDLDEEVEDFRRVALLAPHSPASEAFRQIRTNLLFSGPAEQRRSLLVTSPSPEDGRTTVVMNLAASMAQAGRRVLVVDANFRQPAVAGMFPEAAAAGLSSALVGQAAWRDVVSPTGIPNLFVVTSGPLPPNPADLLGSDAMRQIIDEMSQEYDQVIFDGSPVMLVADACVLATEVDGVLLVVRAGSNSAGIVQRATEHLGRVGARVLGVVLQGVRSTAGGYLRKNYETFYEYHQQALP